jgi:DNA-binding transcriptional LysR family regulator
MCAASRAPNEPSETVRLTANEIVGVEVPPPILTMFRASRPTIDIELSLSKLNQDLTRHDADIAICMAIPTQSTLVARKLGDVTVGLYADRAYLDRHRTPQTFSDLVRHRPISFDADAGGIRARRQAGVSITRELFAFRSDSDRAQLSHPRVRFGIAGHQKGGAARDPRLVAVLAERVRLCACDVAMPTARQPSRTIALRSLGTGTQSLCCRARQSGFGQG